MYLLQPKFPCMAYVISYGMGSNPGTVYIATVHDTVVHMYLKLPLNARMSCRAPFGASLVRMRGVPVGYKHSGKPCMAGYHADETQSV